MSEAHEAEEPNLTFVNIKMFDLYRALVLCYPIFLFTRRLSSAGNAFSSLRKASGYPFALIFGNPGLQRGRKGKEETGSGKKGGERGGEGKGERGSGFPFPLSLSSFFPTPSLTLPFPSPLKPWFLRMLCARCPKGNEGKA